MGKNDTFTLLTKLLMDTSDFNAGVAGTRKKNNELKESFAGVGAAFLGVTAAIGAVMGAVESSKAIIESNMTLSDAWEKQTIGIGNAWDSLTNSLSNLDFSNLFEGLNRAYKAGLKYAEILDLLEDKERGHSVAVSESRKELADLAIIYTNVTKSLTERQDALQQAKNIETRLAKEGAANANELFEATKKKIIDTKELSEAELMGFVKFKDGYETKLALAEHYLEVQKKIRDLQLKENMTFKTGQYSDKNIKLSEEEQRHLNILQSEMRNADKAALALSKVITSIGDSQVKSLADQYRAYVEADAAVSENTLMLEKKYNILELKQDKQIQKAEVEIKTEQDLIDTRQKTIQQLQDIRALNYQQTGRATKEETDAMDKAIMSPLKSADSFYSKGTSKYDEAANLNQFSKLTGAISKQNEDLKKNRTLWDTLGDTITSKEVLVNSFSTAVGGISDAFVSLFKDGTMSFKGFISSMLDGIRSIINGLLAQALASQLAGNSKFGLPGLAMATFGMAAIQGLFASLPAFESGTEYAPGGWSIVGEKGIELMNVPKGSKIYDNSSSLSMLEGKGNNKITINLKAERGALVAALNYDTKLRSITH